MELGHEAESSTLEHNAGHTPLTRLKEDIGITEGLDWLWFASCDNIALAELFFLLQFQ